MKNSRSMKSKLKQVTVKEDSRIELEDLHIILLKKTSKLEQKDINEAKKQNELYELYKNLNPKYFEEAIPIKEALKNLDTSDNVFSSRFKIDRIF